MGWIKKAVKKAKKAVKKTVKNVSKGVKKAVSTTGKGLSKVGKAVGGSVIAKAVTIGGATLINPALGAGVAKAYTVGETVKKVKEVSKTEKKVKKAVKKTVKNVSKGVKKAVSIGGATLIKPDNSVEVAKTEKKVKKEMKIKLPSIKWKSYKVKKPVTNPVKNTVKKSSKGINFSGLFKSGSTERKVQDFQAEKAFDLLKGVEIPDVKINYNPVVEQVENKPDERTLFKVWRKEVV